MDEYAEGLQTLAPAAGGASADLLDVLEAKIAQLVEHHRDARASIQELRGRLKERERRIGELNEKVYALDRVRTDVRKRIDTLIAEIDRFDRGAGRRRSHERRASAR